MNKKNNYNSLIFLTTLSVYLGLVLVGTPPILAQAALTQKIEIQNEAEIKDDLDKKPDEDLFADSIVDLVQELDKLSQKKSFDWNLRYTFQIESLSICESDNSPSFMGFGSDRFQIDRFLENTTIEIARKLYKQKARIGFGDIYSHTSDFDFVFDGGSLEIKAKIGNNNNIAADIEKDNLPFLNELNNYLDQITSTKDATKEKIVAENTKVTTENNQVFIVTHLPRASIDELLAKKVAQ